MKHLLGMFRVLGLAATILVLVASVTLHQAEASLLESLRGFGDQIAQLHGFTPHSAPRRLVVNGLELRVMTVETSLGLAEALDKFQGLCRTVGQIDLAAAVRQKLENRAKDAPTDKTQLPWGVIRKNGEHDGFLACLDVGSGLDAEAFLAKLTEFGATGNLRSLGQLRYAMARRHAGKTTLLMLWTEGDTKFAELFPKQGDAPGNDPLEVPRPRDSRRLLSAFEQGLPYGLAAYAVEGKHRQDVANGYRAALGQSGWNTRVARHGTLIAEKAGRRLLVQVSERRRGLVVVSLSDLG
jgi:hypothetical protein